MAIPEELRIVTIDGVIIPDTATSFSLVPRISKETIGTVQNDSNQMTVLDVSGIAVGMFVSVDGILGGTIVESITGNILTLSNPASRNIITERVVFYFEQQDVLPPLKKGQVIKFYYD